jgi:hypothetical protein
MSRGGSRFGAGRPAHKAKTHHCRSLDVRRMSKAGVLAAGKSGGWAWTDSETGEQRAVIGYRSHGHALQLDFSVNGQSVMQRVPLALSACHLGGSRDWFLCPCCSGRVALLYLRWSRFACRKCNQVAYQSQSEDDCGRAWIKQTRIEAKLGPDRQRPPRMRQATYDRLWAAIDACEAQRDSWLIVAAQRLFPGVRF